MDSRSLVVDATNLGLAQSPVGKARVFTTIINGAAPSAALIGSGGGVASPRRTFFRGPAT